MKVHQDLSKSVCEDNATNQLVKITTSEPGAGCVPAGLLELTQLPEYLKKRLLVNFLSRKFSVRRLHQIITTWAENELFSSATKSAMKGR